MGSTTFEEFKHIEKDRALARRVQRIDVEEPNEGDTVRIYVTNKLPEPTSVHWNGVILENGMDGVAGLTQKSIGVGRRSATSSG